MTRFRIRVIFTINPSTDKKLREYSKKIDFPASRIVEAAVLQYIENKEEVL